VLRPIDQPGLGDIEPSKQAEREGDTERSAVAHEPARDQRPCHLIDNDGTRIALGRRSGSPLTDDESEPGQEQDDDGVRDWGKPRKDEMKRDGTE
jgi:hypothetical protein